MALSPPRLIKGCKTVSKLYVKTFEVKNAQETLKLSKEKVKGKTLQIGEVVTQKS